LFPGFDIPSSFSRTISIKADGYQSITVSPQSLQFLSSENAYVNAGNILIQRQ